MVSPKGHTLSVVRFDFRVINSVIEYEAILVGLCLAKEIQSKATLRLLFLTSC